MKRQQSFQNSQATLYIIATPIGNLSEISPRVITTLKEVEVVFCEDTRVSGQLLNYLNIKKPLISAYENIERQSCEKAIQYLKDRKNIAFLSDAGYPGISDPGHIMIQEAIKNDFNVVVINGPCALIQSVIASGFSTEHFYFYGFLNAKSNVRKDELKQLKSIKDTLIFYQSPHKIEGCLKDMLEIFGNRNICLCRELTKKFEEYIRGTISEILSIVDSLKGEMVVIVQGNQDYLKNENVEFDELIVKVNELIQKGIKTMDAIKEISTIYDVSKKELYQYYHNNGGNQDE